MDWNATFTFVYLILDMLLSSEPQAFHLTKRDEHLFDTCLQYCVCSASGPGLSVL